MKHVSSILCYKHEYYTYFCVRFKYEQSTTEYKKNPGRGEIFHTRFDRPWGSSSLLYGGYRFILGVKRSGCGVNHSPSPSAAVKERVELYLCSPSGLSWPLLKRNLPFLTSLRILAINNTRAAAAIYVFFFYYAPGSAA
jgi:hypothetical protein